MTKKDTRYREYTLEHINHPIRLGDAWSYVHENYDGPGDRRCGFCDSIKECVEAINELDEVEMNDQDADAADRIEFAIRLAKRQLRSPTLKLSDLCVVVHLTDEIASDLATKPPANPA